MLISSMWRRARRTTSDMIRDRNGVAATEFAVIMPMMLVMLFGTVEISSGIAADRKVTLVARALSDLTAQSMSSVADGELQNFFAASASILAPYPVTETIPTISEIYIDSNNIAKIQWSKSATISMVDGSPKAVLKASTRTKGQTVTVPAGLLVKNTYLIWSEVDYGYKPTGGYVVKSKITLHSEIYSRPRQSTCVDYPAPVAPAVACTPAT